MSMVMRIQVSLIAKIEDFPQSTLRSLLIQPEIQPPNRTSLSLNSYVLPLKLTLFLLTFNSSNRLSGENLITLVIILKYLRGAGCTI